MPPLPARYRTKLNPPRPPQVVVSRPRLLSLLADTVRPLTVVSAPPGFGKTLLATAWVSSPASPPSAWVTVDRDDNSGGRFWRAVSASLAELLPDEDDTLVDPDASPVELALALAAAAPGPSLLVLDDFQELEDEAVLRELELFLRYMPAHLQVMLLTRVDPLLPLQRLRVEDRLTELRSSELAFTRDEAGTLFDGLLEPQEVDLLQARTEGWPAALRFAQLAVEAAPDRARFVETFAGDDRAVADYLLTEVLASHSPELQDLLLRISIPDRVTVDLVSRLAPGPNIAATLEQLERENMFVFELAGGPRSYRYHHLFLDFLRSEAERRLGDETARLHAVTARWYAESGEWLHALRHAIAGRDWALAGSTVLDCWRTLYMVEGIGTVGSIVDDIPDEAISLRPELALLAALSLLQRGEVREAERCLDAAGDAFAPDSERQVDLESFATTCRGYAARVRGDAAAAAESARRLLELPPTALIGRDRFRRQQRTVALALLGAAELDLGELDDAEEHIEQALELARLEGAETLALRSLGRLAAIESYRGRLRRADARAHEALSYAVSRGRHSQTHTGAARWTLGWSAYHRNDLDAAVEHAALALRAGRDLGETGETATATLLVALVEAAARPRGAEAALRKLHALAAELAGSPVPPAAARLLALAEPVLQLQRGEVTRARAALELLPEGPESAIVRARIALVDGRPWEALDALALADGAPLAPGCAHLAVERPVLEAVARAGVRDRDGARTALELALGQAAPDGYRRAFLDGGPAVQSLLVEHLRRGSAHRAFLGDVLAAFEGRARKPALAVPQLLEPLSSRELAVLRYLPSTLSNPEIAAELCVSVNTVKTHLRSIYRKLGTTRRRDAVDVARALDIL